MNILITYDISTETSAGTKRLRKIAQLCLNSGQRVQKSVFECEVSELQYERIIHDLKLAMNPREDSIRVYRLRDFRAQSVVHMGRNAPMNLSDPLLF